MDADIARANIGILLDGAPNRAIAVDQRIVNESSPASDKAADAVPAADLDDVRDLLEVSRSELKPSRRSR